MLLKQLRAGSLPGEWRSIASRCALLTLYLLMTVQFVGCYLFLTHPYINLDRFGQGYERLPFQTRLLIAPLFRWAEHNAFMIRYASDLSMNGYFFPHGVGPGGVIQFYIDLPCVLIAGWVAVQIYRSASRSQWLVWLVYPLFLVLCTITYILHVVQNYRFVYDMPSLMFFALGLYLIYFRKPVTLLVALFAVSTWNRETTIFLIPFFLLSACVRGKPVESLRRRIAASQTRTGVAGRSARLPLMLPLSGQFALRRTLRPAVAVPALLMAAYWTAWHVFVFHLFRHNASEYYPRIQFNLYCFRRLRYYPQLFSACGYLLPFLFVYRKRVHDVQLRVWMWMIPVWYAVMAVWGILAETRVFGELLPFVACAGVLIAEEGLAAALRRHRSPETAEEGVDRHLIRAA